MENRQMPAGFVYMNGSGLVFMFSVRFAVRGSVPESSYGIGIYKNNKYKYIIIY
jgi:hypothetical protein